MFYAHFVLSKKGPLARVWLAAHWDKKLTKAHVFETDVEDSVESIISPKVKMALRTSGHLLLGIVRIYSRKAKYLLADCNEAFVKIKMAFRPGMVDLPEEKAEASVAAITLPEVFHDFEAMPDLSEIDIQAQFSMNQSRAEEITMQEDYGNLTLMHPDDDFGGVASFDDQEQMREEVAFDKTLLSADQSSHLLLEESNRRDMDISEPLQNDGFGGGVDEGLLGDGLGGGLFDEGPSTDATARPTSPSPVEARYDSDDDDIGAPMGGDSDDDDAGPPPAKAARMDADLVAGAVSAAAAMKDQTTDQHTTLVPNIEEAFALAPLDETTIHGTERHRTRRRRKLIVDDVKGIDGDDMRSQLSDTTDITTSLDLAPPTKKLMHWKETGGVDKLFALPGRPLTSKYCSKLFTKHLHTNPMKDSEDWQLHDQLQLIDEQPSAENLRNQLDDTRQKSTLEEQASGKPLSPASDYYGPQTPYTPGPMTPYTPGPTDLAELDQLAGTTSAADLPADLMNLEPQRLDQNPEDTSIVPQNLTETPLLGPTADQLHEKTTEDEQQRDDETQEEFDARVVSKRSHVLLRTLNKQLGKGRAQASFLTMCRGDDRKQAAARFYALLVLKKNQVVQVEQTKPFGDIIIQKGDNFASEVRSM